MFSDQASSDGFQTDSKRAPGEEPQRKETKKVYKQNTIPGEKDSELKFWIAPCKSNSY